MKIQLLALIAVVISSLLTISQRVNAHEVTQLRWIDPTIDQKFCEVVVPDQEKSSDTHFVYSDFYTSKVLARSLPDFIYNHLTVHSRIISNKSPRAPPVSSI